jgi:carbamoyl-phosphate synthase large subunit
MKTILVSGASGIVGYGILRSLRQSALPSRLIGSTIYADSIAPAFCDIFELAPPTQDATYIPWLCQILRAHHVDLLIPSIECDVYKWNDCRDEIKTTGAIPLLNNSTLINLCRDKWLFYLELMCRFPELAIPTRIDGDFDSLADAFSLPFILKPRRGFASKGIVRVTTKSEFEAHQKQFGANLMAQPIIGSPDEEYTTSGFFDQQGTLSCYMTLKRKLSPEGYTQVAEVAEIHEIENVLLRLGETFQALGPTNFQFRLQHNNLKLLEINPRISSATSIRSAFGYNESLMSANYFLNHLKPGRPRLRSGRAIRYVEDYIFYDSPNF